MPTLLWYILLGALHEISHLVAAAWFGLLDFSTLYDEQRHLWSLCNSLLGIVIERRWQTTFDESIEHGRQISMIRHIGWVCSVCIAVVAYYLNARKRANTARGSPLDNPAVWAAVITALEALSTDLLRLEQYVLPLFPAAIEPSKAAFFCGNFGLILLNPAYTSTSNGQKTALDILEKMISGERI